MREVAIRRILRLLKLLLLSMGGIRLTLPQTVNVQLEQTGLFTHLL